MAEIDYFLSVNSPWVYLGSARLAQIARRYRAKIHTRPVRLLEVFAETGGLPLPRRSAERQAYRMLELKRWRDRLGIAINLEPKYFPADERDATRIVLAAAQGGDDAHALATEIGRAIWEREENIADPGVVDAAAARIGLDAGQLRRRLSEEYGEVLLDANTSAARSAGVFGAPAYVIEGELFWGQDRLDFVEQKLATLASGG